MENKKLLVAVGCSLLLSGCSSFFNIGELPTECPGTERGGITCTSARDIWKLADNPSALSKARQKSEAMRAEDYNEEEYEAAQKEAAEEAGEAYKQKIQLPYPGGTIDDRKAIYQNAEKGRSELAAPEPIAVREQSKILRVLFNSWEDGTGRLHMPGYTYIEIEPRRWSVGRGMTVNPARVTPLSIRKKSLTEERKHNPTEDNGMGIIQPKTRK